MEDNQLFNLATPAPVLDGRPSFGGSAEPRRKYCTHGLKVPLQVSNSRDITTRGSTLTISYPETLERGFDP